MKVPESGAQSKAPPVLLPPHKETKPEVPPKEEAKPEIPPKEEESKPHIPPGQELKPDLPPGQELQPHIPPGQELKPDLPPGQELQPHTPPGQQPSNKKGIKVLSYNICWECMSNSSDGTAGNLGKKCHWTTKNGIKVTECAINIANNIDMISAHYGGMTQAYDFVGLQEASNWKDLKKISEALSMLKTADIKDTHGVRNFYDPSKYTLAAGFNAKFESGRPIQILIFKEGVIFVNLHAPHIHSDYKNYVETKLSEALHKGLGKDLSKYTVEDLKNYRIIITGDFNDHKGALIEAEKDKHYFTPFRHAGLMTPVYITSKKDELGSCCSTAIPHPRSKMVGDYVFDSVPKSNFEHVRIKVPSNYDYSRPASDHLPVIYEAR